MHLICVIARPAANRPGLPRSPNLKISIVSADIAGKWDSDGVWYSDTFRCVEAFTYRNLVCHHDPVLRCHCRLFFL